MRHIFTLLPTLLRALPAAGRAAGPLVLSDNKPQAYVDRFNAPDAEDLINAVLNTEGFEFLRRKLPRLDNPRRLSAVLRCA